MHEHAGGDKWAVNEDGVMHDIKLGRVSNDADDCLRNKVFIVPADRYLL